MKDKTAPDFLLISIVLILTGLGLITVYSSSAIYALDRFGSSTYFFWRQFLWIIIGVSVAIFFILYDHRKLKNWVKPLLGICFLLLIAVLVFGKEVSGARRWIRLGVIGFQPSELAKMALVFFVAYYCDRRRSKIENFRHGLVPMLVVVGTISGLIFLQPDFGTPVLIALTCMTMIFIGGGSPRQLGGVALALVPLFALAIWTEPYRIRRILAFLDPWKHSQGEGYQLVQSLLAFGSGGLIGVGLGDSRSKLLYLPEPHTDFIFPIFAEEFGLIGSWGVIFLFGMLTWLGFRIAARSANLFSSLLATGITLMVLYQAAFNIAMVTGCIPTKGFPLPFMSFGGSSLIVTLACMGILLNISRTAKRARGT